MTTKAARLAELRTTYAMVCFAMHAKDDLEADILNHARTWGVTTKRLRAEMSEMYKAVTLEVSEGLVNAERILAAEREKTAKKTTS